MDIEELAKYFSERYKLNSTNLGEEFLNFNPIGCDEPRVVVSVFKKCISIHHEDLGWIESREEYNKEREVGITLEDYFSNWRCPTNTEKEMFKMLFGVELFWSEDNPFEWPEEEN